MFPTGFFVKVFSDFSSNGILSNLRKLLACLTQCDWNLPTSAFEWHAAIVKDSSSILHLKSSCVPSRKAQYSCPFKAIPSCDWSKRQQAVVHTSTGTSVWPLMLWALPKEPSSWRWGRIPPPSPASPLLLLPSLQPTAMVCLHASTLSQLCMVLLSTSTVQSLPDPPEGPSGSYPPRLSWNIDTGNLI